MTTRITLLERDPELVCSCGSQSITLATSDPDVEYVETKRGAREVERYKLARWERISCESCARAVGDYTLEGARAKWKARAAEYRSRVERGAKG